MSRRREAKNSIVTLNEVKHLPEPQRESANTSEILPCGQNDIGSIVWLGENHRNARSASRSAPMIALQTKEL
jgi:hypothetical protein